MVYVVGLEIFTGIYSSFSRLGLENSENNIHKFFHHLGL